MAKQKTQTSAIESMFGRQAHYPASRPVKLDQMRLRRWRIWHRFTAVAALTPVWLAAILAPVTVITGDYWLWATEAAVAYVCLFAGATRSGSGLPPHERPYLPAFWRSVHGVSNKPFSAEEMTLLEVVWALGGTIGRLKEARGRLERQLSEIDQERVGQFSTQASDALAHGERSLAKSLLEAQAQAEEHHRWVESQLKRLDEQIAALSNKQFHLKTRLALHQLQQRALAVQIDANQTRAGALELFAASSLDDDVELDLSEGDLLELKESALEAEARVLALEELGQGLEQPEVVLEGKALEQALEELKLEIGITGRPALTA